VKLTEKAPEIEKFREALNMFFRFLAGEGRDNCERVFKIVCLDPPIVVSPRRRDETDEEAFYSRDGLRRSACAEKMKRGMKRRM